MEQKAIATLSKTREVLEKHSFHFKKNYGQNFLIDVNILKKIISKAEVNKDTCVIEIGAGIGSLTEQLAISAKKVITYEIDKSLIPILNETLQNYENVKIINEDILKADVQNEINKEFKDCKDIAVIANLPYYITTPILMKLIKDRLPINRYCVMMQKEVAQRLCGKANTKEYNALTISVQYYTIPKIVMNVPSTVFIPKPKVESAVIMLTTRVTPPVKILDEELFFKIVKGSFIQRRKTIINNLKHFIDDVMDKNILLKALEESNINPSIRGEALTIEQFANLSNNLYLHIN